MPHVKFYILSFGSVTIRRNVRPKMNADRLRHLLTLFRNSPFAAKRFVRSDRTQKILLRASSDLSISTQRDSKKIFKFHRKRPF